jgi:vancomycin resistance protein VanW
MEIVLAEHSSPLLRVGVTNEKLQKGKEQNVRRAASLIDAIVIEPGQVFSYHHVVGRPSRLRGFTVGLELHAGESSAGVGGGCCQVSNMLYLLALRSGMEIVERHRHQLDLFPDHGRTVPFGCGATVYYNIADLRFRNTMQSPVRLSLTIDNGQLVGKVLASEDPGFRVEVYETDHHFHKDCDAWVRENRIHRKFVGSDGSVIRDEEVAHNVGRCLYDPEAPD